MRCVPVLVGLLWALSGCGSSLEAPAAAKQDKHAAPKSPRQQRIDSLHALGAAMHRYHEEYNQFPTAATYDRDDVPLQFRKPLLSWRVAILPFLGHSELFAQFKQDEPWDSAHNKKLLDKMPAVYASPGARPRDSFVTRFQLIHQVGTDWVTAPPTLPLRYLAAAGLLSPTLLVVEANETVPWTKPADVIHLADKPPQFGGAAPDEDTFPACFADGAVRAVKKSLPDRATYDRLLRALVYDYRRQRTSVEAIVDSTALAPPSVFSPEPKDAKEQRRRSLRRLWSAMIHYHHVHERLPMPALIKGEPYAPHELLLSWRVALLPYLGEEELYRQFRLAEPWDSPHNIKLLERMPKVFAAPNAKAEKETSTFYQVLVAAPPFSDWSPIFRGHGDRLTLGQLSVQDGPDSTLMLVEAATAVPWTKPEDVVIEDRKPLPKFGGIDPQDPEFFACFAGGAVQSFKRSLPDAAAYERVMRALIGRRDGVRVDVGLVVSQKKPPAPAPRQLVHKPAGTVREQRIARLRELAIALHMFQEDNAQLPQRDYSLYLRHIPGTGVSWRVLLLPYFGAGEHAHKSRSNELTGLFRPNEPWNRGGNEKLLARMPLAFAAPGVKNPDPTTTYYQVFYTQERVGGPAALFEDPQYDSSKGFGTLKAMSKEDAANTFLVVEAGEPVPWTKAADLAYDHTKPLPKLGGVAPDEDEFLACFADGSVRAVKKPQPGNAEQEAAIRKLILRKGMPDPNAGVPKK